MRPTLLALGVLLFASGNVLAQDESAHSFSATGYLVSDYNFRGVSQTEKDPVFQLQGDYAHSSGFYAGIWASPVEFGDELGTDNEVDFYVGYGWSMGESWGADVSVLRYTYYGGNDPGDLEYTEVIGKLTYAETVTLTVGYSNDVFALDDDGLYVSLGFEKDIGRDFTLSASLGNYTFADGLTEPKDNYIDFSVGLSHPLGPFDFSVSYVGTNGAGRDIFGVNADNRLLAVLSYSYPGEE